MARGAGVLLHPTSLPGAHGVGDLGNGAFAFIDWLHASGIKVWQILPLVIPGPGESPYSSLSSFAGNWLLIDLEQLAEEGLLAPEDLSPQPDFAVDQVDYEAVRAWKWPRLVAAADRLAALPESALYQEFDAFRTAHEWLSEVSAFLALREARFLKPWWEWEPALRRREPEALAQALAQQTQALKRWELILFFFERQWQAVLSYAHQKGIQLLGDLPIYVDADSADVWANQGLFRLDEAEQLEAVAGVPPDFFSETGQRWGNPLYRWERMAEDGFAWWMKRVKRALSLVDLLRFDHFRGFSAYWEIPANTEDAREGTWQQGPGATFFEVLKQHHPELPFIAEDLGDIDEAVLALRDQFTLPGMTIVQFAFGERSDHPFLPHMHVKRSVAYTATHDNNTILGWWQSCDEGIRDHVRHYLARSGEDIVWDLIRSVMASVAELAVIPMQDVLTLDAGARMNTPGLAKGNWGWRVRQEAFHPGIAARLRHLTGLYGRT